MESIDPLPVFETLRARLGRRTPLAVDDVGAPRAAVAVVLAWHAEQLDLLLIRRAERKGDPWSGHMGLPGGRMDPGDVDLFATAQRETREEVQLELGEPTLLGRLDDLHPVWVRQPSIVVRPYVFGVHGRPAVGANHEVAYHRWVPLDELARTRGPSVVEHRGARREVPSYRLGEDVVWGMTHKILDPLVDLFE